MTQRFELMVSESIDDPHWFSSVRQGSHPAFYKQGKVYLLGTALEVKNPSQVDNLHENDHLTVHFEQRPDFLSCFVATKREAKAVFLYENSSSSSDYSAESPPSIDNHSAPNTTQFANGKRLSWIPVKLKRRTQVIPPSALVHIMLDENLDLPPSKVRFFERPFSREKGALLCRPREHAFPLYGHEGVTRSTPISCPQCSRILNNLFVRLTPESESDESL